MDEDRAEVNRAPEGIGQKLSRRGFLKGSVLGVTVGGVGALSACMYQPTGSKVGTTPKAVALYQNSPNMGRSCSGCTHFLEPNACEVVAGEISPNGWCRYHEPKPA
jgi:anaerobic selenocysteine-containing dehydrogenase